jgi:TrmH family RNA methyltransferase
MAGSARERRKAKLTLLDGAHLVDVALQARWPLRELVVSDQGLMSVEICRLLEQAGDTPVLHLPDALFVHVSPVDSPSGVLALIDLPETAEDVLLIDSVVILDAVQDTGNLGTILRTAAAAGIREALLTSGCAQAWAPRVLRAGMGAHFGMRIHEQADVGALLHGYTGQILATGLGAGARPLYEYDLRGAVAWMFGAEGQGLSPELSALATGKVIIPMPGGMESLNVGAAAAVCLFEQVRQRL